MSSLEPVAESGEFPDRDDLVDIYSFLRRARVYTERYDICALVKAFNNNTGKNFSTYTFDSAIKVFEELGLVILNSDKNTFDMMRPKNKLDLNNSRTFRLGRREQDKGTERGKIISLEQAKRAMSLTQ